jgi:DNA-binding NarL/FixJ family response regulator
VSRILIVDDHPSFRAAARAVLEGDGHEVVGEAADGAQAIVEARRLAPDIVLLDVQLPDMDGFAVARAITGRGGSPCVVLVSSRDAADYGSAIRDCGASGFIPKADLCCTRLAALLPLRQTTTEASCLQTDREPTL